MFGRFEVFLTVCFLFTQQAIACSAAPQAYTRHHADLVRDTDSIVLAKVVGPSKQSSDRVAGQASLAQFATIEVIKGNASSTFTIPNGSFLHEQGGGYQDFRGHSELGFWERSVTRQWNGPDCQMRPIFLQGRTYLLFLGTPHWRGYEEIAVADDLWLEAVRTLVADPSLKTGLSVQLKDWFSMAKGIFRGSIVDCSGPTLRVDKEILGNFESEWAYTRNDHSRYWPYHQCIEGKEYLVMTIADEQSPLPRYSSMVYRIVGDFVYISAGHDSQIEVDKRLVSLDEVEGYFRSSQPLPK